MKEKTYPQYLYELLHGKHNDMEIPQEFIFNLYLTLLFLNSGNYKESDYRQEIEITENFLRKVNNYKVKIQLKRKDDEITKLYDEIKEIYANNYIIIDRYNKDKLDILGVMETREASDITKLIDALTKAKISKVNHLTEYDKLIKEIKDNFHTYYLADEHLTINGDSVIALADFYDIFSYLTDKDNYFRSNISNDMVNSHREIVTSIVTMLDKKIVINDNHQLIPVVLSYLFVKDIPNYETIMTDKFHIENIKISDLYALANNNSGNVIGKAKWRNIIIPNDYLYRKIKDIVHVGSYYIKDERFIFENNGKLGSDFKISIAIDDMLSFLKDNLSLLIGSNV